MTTAAASAWVILCRFAAPDLSDIVNDGMSLGDTSRFHFHKREVREKRAVLWERLVERPK